MHNKLNNAIMNNISIKRSAIKNHESSTYCFLFLLTNAGSCFKYTMIYSDRCDSAINHKKKDTKLKATLEKIFKKQITIFVCK